MRGEGQVSAGERAGEKVPALRGVILTQLRHLGQTRPAVGGSFGLSFYRFCQG